RERTGRCRLVALTHCSNVTGAVSDVARIVAAARAVGAKVMIDGAQRAPHGTLDVRALGIDFYAFSGHKAYGPTGIGVLWGRREWLAAMPPFMTGGHMIDRVGLTEASFRAPPRRFEAGTPPIAAAVGLGAALDFMQELDWQAIQGHELRLVRRLLDGLAAMKGVRVVGPLDTTDRGAVVTFAVDGFSPEAVCLHLDDHGVAMRGGYHCAQPLFTALGVDGAARASFALYNLDGDVDALLEGLEDLIRHRGARQPGSG
ncbi:MAG: aminotransferase class V-fold PLP-dependent enzyme, partial [Candidatus Eiseniibacteriota bacterium]